MVPVGREFCCSSFLITLNSNQYCAGLSGERAHTSQRKRSEVFRDSRGPWAPDLVAAEGEQRDSSRTECVSVNIFFKFMWIDFNFFQADRGKIVSAAAVHRAAKRVWRPNQTVRLATRRASDELEWENDWTWRRQSERSWAARGDRKARSWCEW